MANKNKRQYQRFGTDVRISFTKAYDFQAEVGFEVEREKKSGCEKKYIGISKNISVCGLCFDAPKELNIGDLLWIELHLPKHGELIYMEGEVRWSRRAPDGGHECQDYETGVLIKKVDGAQVEETVYFDENYKIVWSRLLERVLGGFAKMQKKKSS